MRGGEPQFLTLPLSVLTLQRFAQPAPAFVRVGLLVHLVQLRTDPMVDHVYEPTATPNRMLQRRDLVLLVKAAVAARR